MNVNTNFYGSNRFRLTTYGPTADATLYDETTETAIVIKPVNLKEVHAAVIKNDVPVIESFFEKRA